MAQANNLHEGTIKHAISCFYPYTGRHGPEPAFCIGPFDESEEAEQWLREHEFVKKQDGVYTYWEHPTNGFRAWTMNCYDRTFAPTYK